MFFPFHICCLFLADEKFQEETLIYFGMVHVNLFRLLETNRNLLTGGILDQALSV